MATQYFTHKIVKHDGKSIEIPPYSGLTGFNLAKLQIPDPYGAAHATQKYPIETVFRDGDRTFVYGKWSATTSVKTAGYAVCTVATFKDLANTGISGEIGDSALVLNYGAACAVNKYAGGYIGMKGSQYRSWRIVSNTVQDASNYVTITIDGTLLAKIVSTDDFVLMENPYNEMRWFITNDTRPYVGVTVSTIVASYYGWIQTWGTHMMCSAHNSWEGADGYQQGVWIVSGAFQALPSNASIIVHGAVVAGGARQAGWFAAGSDPSSPADVSIAYPVYLTFRP